PVERPRLQVILLELQGHSFAKQGRFQRWIKAKASLKCFLSGTGVIQVKLAGPKSEESLFARGLKSEGFLEEIRSFRPFTRGVNRESKIEAAGRVFRLELQQPSVGFGRRLELILLIAQVSDSGPDFRLVGACLAD